MCRSSPENDNNNSKNRSNDNNNVFGRFVSRNVVRRMGVMGVVGIRGLPVKLLKARFPRPLTRVVLGGGRERREGGKQMTTSSGSVETYCDATFHMTGGYEEEKQQKIVVEYFRKRIRVSNRKRAKTTSAPL